MDQLEHYGVKGMKWGVRRAGKAYMSATRKHEAKTKARREKVKNIKAAEKAHAKEVWSKAGKSYMNAARKHEAKTQARRDGQVAAKKERKLARAEKKWEKNTKKNLSSMTMKAYNDSVDTVNAGLDKLNKKTDRNPKKYTTNGTVNKNYLNEYNKLVVSSINKELGKMPSSVSPSKKKAVRAMIAGENIKSDIVDISKD